MNYSIKVIIVCLLLLNLLSLLSIYSSSHQAEEFRQRQVFYRQMIWITISWIGLIVFSFINYHFYFDLALPFYAFNILMLIGVYFFGREVMGAQRWLSLGWFNFQPSEISKIITVFILAKFFSSPSKNNIKKIIIPFILIGIIAFLIFNQPDLGTGCVLIILFFMVGLSSAVRKGYLIGLLIGIFILSPFAWNFLKDYQKKRFIVFLNPDVEPLGAGYTIIQSKIAIGSGKILGKGFLSGTQNQFNFLPERHTDFIFTVIAEEWGFLGSLFLLLIYWTILQRILKESERVKEPFARNLILGIGSLFFLHIFINIGMTLGILPVVGLPLLFLSYGGSHLLTSFILVGIFFNVVRNQ